jgi:peptide chain release factor 3
MASGKYTPGMKLKVQRTAKELRPTSVVTFLSQRREAVDEAYAGDIIGFTTHGGVQLGDTITDGANLQFTGLPFFAPELFMTVVLKNPLRTKQLQQGLAQLGEEGAIQVFRPEIGGPMLLGAVGQLQFEVVQHRLKAEYDCDVRLEGCQYTGARWITADTPAELKAFTDAYPQADGAGRGQRPGLPVHLAYDVRLAQERFPKIHFHLLREHAGLALQLSARLSFRWTHSGATRSARPRTPPQGTGTPRAATPSPSTPARPADRAFPGSPAPGSTPRRPAAP